MAEGFDISMLFGEYRDEARQQLDLLDAVLLDVEREGELPPERRAELLRALHTLKGNSGMLGLARVRDFVHALEEVFRSPPAEWIQRTLDRLFEAAAYLRRAVEAVGTEEQDEAFRQLPELGEAEVIADSSAPAPTSPAPGYEEPEAPAAAEFPPAAEPPTVAPDELLRVPLGKLDALLGRIADLVQLGARFDDLLRSHRAELEETGLLRPFAEQLELIERTTEGLRGAAMELRLVPVGRVFGRFPSLVRDLAREEEKRVRVVIEGEDTELDKSTVDALAEPLLHLVRNAVDHGIELPAERESRGKAAEGTLLLRAERSGDQVRIIVEDDGRGLNPDAIVERAREVGILAPGEGRDWSTAEAAELLFRPGFSTRREASTVSGRGIGLDVVRQTVRRLRGNLTVEEVPGGGTRFMLRLPLTLAIVPAVIFESEGATLALPAADVAELLRTPAPERAGAVDVVMHRGEVIPLARPARLFGWAAEREGGAAGEFVLVVRRGARSAAVTANQLLEQRDVVLKPLPAYLGPTRGVAGATVAPDGRVILLLDPAGLIELNLNSQRRRSRVGTA